MFKIIPTLPGFKKVKKKTLQKVLPPLLCKEKKSTKRLEAATYQSKHRIVAHASITHRLIELFGEGILSTTDSSWTNANKRPGDQRFHVPNKSLPNFGWFDGKWCVNVGNHPFWMMINPYLENKLRSSFPSIINWWPPRNVAFQLPFQKWYFKFLCFADMTVGWNPQHGEPPVNIWCPQEINGCFWFPQLAIYKWYISGIYCQLGDYISPTTY